MGFYCMGSNWSESTWVRLADRFYCTSVHFLMEFSDDVVDPTVLAASLEGVVPPGLLLAEALDVGLGPMVLP